ncbi:hypothetical protein GGF32_007239 [Allomyces javanicus]|nr:hypothetical protein GGF32_007239 [Allomyces javanicus]
MKIQALFVLAAVAAFVAADANPFWPARAASEDAFIDDVGFSATAAPAPITQQQRPHLNVAAALKKPTKPGQRGRRRSGAKPKKPLTPEQKRKRQAKMRARRARLVKAGKNVAGRVGKTVKTRSTTGVKRPRTHGKLGGMTRKPKAGARKPKGSLATRLQKKINSLPVGSPLRKAYERRLARLLKPKTATVTAPLMSLAGSGYDYASFDDAWDESYDDMWEDNYEGDFSVEDAYDEDAADDEYYGSDFSVSEDAAYEGDDMWEDNYDGDFSVEDAYDEDAADDEY